MESQSERVPGGLGMSFNVESMVQDGSPEQGLSTALISTAFGPNVNHLTFKLPRGFQQAPRA